MDTYVAIHSQVGEGTELSVVAWLVNDGPGFQVGVLSVKSIFSTIRLY